MRVARFVMDSRFFEALRGSFSMAATTRHTTTTQAAAIASGKMKEQLEKTRNQDDDGNFPIQRMAVPEPADETNGLINLHPDILNVQVRHQPSKCKGQKGEQQ